jgi:hypothetical protein
MMEGDVLAKDANNRAVKLSDLNVHPHFYRPDGKPMVLHLASVDSSGNIIKRYSLSVSGMSGEITLLRRKPCKPLMDNASSNADEEAAAEEVAQDDEATEQDDEE